MNKKINTLFASLLSLGALTVSNSALATIVEFQTNHGNFEVNLFDKTTPKTVENFLKYVNQGSYDNTIIHRAVPGFIVQGGGSTFNNSLPLSQIETFDPITNEPVWSNIKGTIAMAKVGGLVDSATSQWFFNLKDNSSNLDLQNGGFTVFGQVSEEGIAIIETISNFNKCKETSDHLAAEFPVTDFSCTNGTIEGISAENMVSIIQTSVIDDDANSADILSPKKNTLLEDSKNTPDSGSSSGGSLNWLGLLALGLISIRKRIKY